MVLGCSWGTLGVSWGVLGRLGELLGHPWEAPGALWEHPGVSWDAPGAPWGAPWASLGSPGATQNRSKNDPKLDSKTVRIATEKNGPNTTPVMVSELDKGRREPDPGRLEIYLNRY